VLTTYIQAAMAHAHYELLPEDQTFYGEIPELQGVWANTPTLESRRAELQEVLEDWLLLGLRLGHTIPVVDGIDLDVRVPA
jgi:predicted RNase H-like HicB family nuclease